MASPVCTIPLSLPKFPILFIYNFETSKRIGYYNDWLF